MLDLLAHGYELRKSTMTTGSSKPKRRIFGNNTRALRRNSYIFYMILLVGYIWPVLTVEQPGILTSAKSQEQLTFTTQARDLEKGDNDKIPKEGSKHVPSSDGKNKKVSTDPGKSATNSEESKPNDQTPQRPARVDENAPTDSPVESPSAEVAEIESKNSDSPTAFPVAVKPENAPAVSPENLKETDSPTAAPMTATATETPTAAPVKATATETPTAAPVKATLTEAPTAAPVEATLTEAPTAAPVTSKPTKTATAAPVTSKPTKTPTASPVKSKPTDVPTKTPLDDGGACTPARTCAECKDLAESLETEAGSTKTCVWKDGTCQIGDKAGATAILCDKNPPAVDAEDSLFLNRPGQAVFGCLVILVFACILLRRYMKRSPTTRVNNTVNYGKYQGVNTVSEDEDEEWGWDDDKPKHRNTLEMTHMTSGHRSMSGGSSNTPRHRRSVSPQLVGNSVSAPAERKGFAVRKTGMNNPLHQAAKAPGASVVPKTTAAVVPPVARKMIPPSTDDFFAEMGVASKPKLPPPAAKPATKRLHATVLRMESDDALETTGGDNWGDDADLDDLLDS